MKIIRRKTSGFSFRKNIQRALIYLVLLVPVGSFAQFIPMAFWKSAGPTCPGGGYAYAGYCYFLTATGDDCFATCSSYGGCLASATGTLAKVKADCKSAVNYFGLNPGGSSGGTNSYAYACATSASTYYYDTGTVTSCGAKNASLQRVCACGSGGTTQAGVGTADGYNYRLGATAASCDTACASYGGCNLAGITNAASSGAKCDQLLSLLDVSTTGTAGGSSAVGCGYQNVLGARYLGSVATTCAATLASTQRVCACNNP